MSESALGAAAEPGELAKMRLAAYARAVHAAAIVASGDPEGPRAPVSGLSDAQLRALFSPQRARELLAGLPNPPELPVA
jgi:hypothetical protein